MFDGSGYMMVVIWHYFSTVSIGHTSIFQRRYSETYLSVDMEAWSLPLARPDRCVLYKILGLRSWKELSTVISGSPCEVSVGYRSARTPVIVSNYPKTTLLTQTGSMIHPRRFF